MNNVLLTKVASAIDIKKNLSSGRSRDPAARSRSAIANLLTLIEPLLISLLGITIGSNVIAMYLPLFTLICKLSQGH